MKNEGSRCGIKAHAPETALSRLRSADPGVEIRIAGDDGAWCWEPLRQIRGALGAHDHVWSVARRLEGEGRATGIGGERRLRLISGGRI